MITQIVIGDDAVFSATLKKDGATFSIDAGATVQAMLVSVGHDAAYTAAVTLSSGATGADWPNSLIVVEFSAAETSAINVTGHAFIEVQVDDTIKETFFGSAYIVQGQIP